LIEVVGGIILNSLALLADAGHLFTDVAGIGLALFAIRIAGRPALPSGSPPAPAFAEPARDSAEGIKAPDRGLGIFSTRDSL